jgi:quinol monooxygenase YgiN
MTAYNIVRFRTRPGKDGAFIAAHESAVLTAAGFRRGALIRTGDSAFCFIGEWNDMGSLAAARPAMIDILSSFRDLLEDLGGGLGVTDPVSGTVVAEVTS